MKADSKGRTWPGLKDKSSLIRAATRAVKEQVDSVENCEHGFIRASCVQCRKETFYKWNGKPTRNRTVITLSIEVATRREDSIEVLSDALAGDAINALLGEHKIPACRVRSILYYSPAEARAIEESQN